jgi:hypothetical protein
LGSYFGGLAHGLAIPHLPAPAAALRIDDAGACAAAAVVFLHGVLLYLLVLGPAPRWWGALHGVGAVVIFVESVRVNGYEGIALSVPDQRMKKRTQ